MNKRINSIYENALKIQVNAESKFVLMSDLHRNNGSAADSFLPNQNIALSAVSHYYNSGFTYMELGDGDELWMNKNMNEIKNVHRPFFSILKDFHEQNRLFMIYGNHDMKKKMAGWAHKNMSVCSQECGCCDDALFVPEFYEGILLQF